MISELTRQAAPGFYPPLAFVETFPVFSPIPKDRTGPRFGEVDGSIVSGAVDLITQVSRTLDLPMYSASWDGLNDWLRDEDVMVPHDGYCLTIRHGMALWQKRPKDIATLIECWVFCSEYWKPDKVLFQLVVCWDE